MAGKTEEVPVVARVITSGGVSYGILKVSKGMREVDKKYMKSKNEINYMI